MAYLLDTNLCAAYLNGRSPAIRQRLDSMAAESLFVCSVVRAELLFGAAKSQNPTVTEAKQRAFLNRFVSLPFDDSAAAVYAKIRADLERRGEMIGANDLMIASIALANNLAVVTHNVSEFGRIAGVRLEDWQTD